VNVPVLLPELELASGRLWEREAVEKWAGANGRQIAKH
jgi:hypothetical protein